MDFVEQVRIGSERAQAGIRAEKNCPPAVLGAWIIGWIGIAKNPATQGDELLMFLTIGNPFRHLIK